MSDLPGEITKQMRMAPPSTSRSTRYSLTARGRSRSPSVRLPTGSSSFENASGCIRLPWPAAGTMPHICTSATGTGTREVVSHGNTPLQRGGEHVFEIARAAGGGVFAQRTVAGGRRNARQRVVREVERVE